jgi:hypothetical protein
MFEDRTVTVRRHSEAAEENASEAPGIDHKRRRSGRRAWRGGLADQTVIQNLEDARSYRSFERALVDSVDPRSVLELALMDPINRRCFKLLPEPMVTR